MENAFPLQRLYQTPPMPQPLFLVHIAFEEYETAPTHLADLVECHQLDQSPLTAEHSPLNLL